MNIEEKARAYDEALARCKEWASGTWGHSVDDSPKDIAEFIFPELRESEDEGEDERIRKEILGFIKSFWADHKESIPRISSWLAYLEKQKGASKAIEAVERIDKYIDEHVANAHDMKDSNPDKKYYRGWDDALGKMAGILQDVYSGEKQKESLRDFIDNLPYSDEQKEQSITANDLDEEIHRFFDDCIDVHEAKLCGSISERVIPVDCYELTARHFAKWGEKQKEPKWSPSEGEMGVLYKLCYLSNQITDEDDTELTRLYQDLKREYFNGHSFENMFPKEKQKEQKHPNGCFTCDEYKKGYEEGRRNGFTAGYNKAMKEVEQKEQKPVVTHGETYRVDTLGTQQVIAGKMPQKPAEWSEEDKNKIESIKGLITMGKFVDTNTIKTIWKLLDSLRPQPKVEWSEEDEEMLNSCICSIEESKENRYAYKENDGDTSYDREIAWLKSLRSRVGKEFLQPHWKPSEDEERLIKTSISFLKDFADKGYENAVECIDWLKSKLNGDACK